MSLRYSVRYGALVQRRLNLEIQISKVLYEKIRHPYSMENECYVGSDKIQLVPR